MKSWANDKTILEYIIGLKSSGKSWEEIFFATQEKFPHIQFKSPDSLRRRFSDHSFSLKGNFNDVCYQTYDEAYKSLCAYIGKKKEPEKRISKSDEEKILVLADFHIPFENDGLIMDVIKEHKDASRVVIAGDFMDCYSVSRFTKKKTIPLKEELTSAISMIDIFASNFKDTVILTGNHTDRVRKYFETKIDPSLMFLVNYDVLKLATQNHSNVRIENTLYQFGNGGGEAEIGHFTVVGKDCVIAHFERSNRIPLKATIDSYNWLLAWGKLFNIEGIRLFLQGHTHRLSKYPINNGETVVGETGTMAQVQDYTVDSSPTYPPHVNGYWVVYQKKGVTDLNKSNFYIL